LSRVERELAFVVHKRAWRDTSLIVELFTAGHGRVGAIARAARNPRSTFFGLTEPFRVLEAGWVRRGELATVTALEPAGNARRLNGRALWCGLYANELLLRLTPRDDPEPQIFEAYRMLLPQLADPASQAGALRRFEMALLRMLAFRPEPAGSWLAPPTFSSTFPTNHRKFRMPVPASPCSSPKVNSSGLRMRREASAKFSRILTWRRNPKLKALKGSSRI